MNYYRYEQMNWAAPVDEFDRPCGNGTVEVVEREYPVLKRTAKGVWLDLGFGEKRFVRDSAKKRFACPTKREAVESFMKRKERQIFILTRQLEVAKVARKLIEQPEGSRRQAVWGFV